MSSSLVSKINWTQLSTSLGLKASTVASLNGLRQRYGAARAKLADLESSVKDVDFAAYRTALQNKKIVDEIEAKVKAFKPVTYDVAAQVKAIEAFEAKAVENAQETAKAVENELTSLNKTLENIQSARPFEQLTMDDVANAAPEIDKKLEELVSEGRWVVPGYKEKFGDYTVM